MLGLVLFGPPYLVDLTFRGTLNQRPECPLIAIEEQYRGPVPQLIFRRIVGQCQYGVNGCFLSISTLTILLSNAVVAENIDMRVWSASQRIASIIPLRNISRR